MSLTRILLVPLAAAALAAAPASAANHDHGAADAHPQKSAAPKKAAQPKGAKGAQVVELTVTNDGFVPDLVTVKEGKPVRLVVTRKADRTCATEIVSKELGIDQPLPLGKTVTIDVAAKKAGSYRFACAMDMIGGTLNVE